MTTPLISAEKMTAYRAFARKRQQQRCHSLHDRHQLGLAVAKQAAVLLKQEFKAEKVALFGSMLSFAHIHERLDVDLAVWDLNPQAYYRAVGCLLALDSRISVDLIEAELASPRIRSTIETTGVVL
ncbi:MAG: nucleotidyltransferase domain-containing protein [Phormidesmis sp. CAN_BIN44]|nr:nucleotidyltransferase domain-containing protein [Phormidesmis sp. CAN_BIN44]